MTMNYALCFYSALAIVASYVIYEIFLHPLSKFRGPFWAKFSYIPYCYWVIRGDFGKKLNELHAQYGTAVRVGPNTVSIASAQGLETIYGNSRPTFLKNDFYDGFAFDVKDEPVMFLERDLAKHAKIRSAFAACFTHKAVLEQGPTLQKYVMSFCEKLKEMNSDFDGVDVHYWARCVSSDVISDLAFGAPFGSLESGKLHFWIEPLGMNFFFASVRDCLRHYPVLLWLSRLWMPASVLETRQKMIDYSHQQMEARFSSKEKRNDFVTMVQENPESKQLASDKIRLELAGMIIAGTETLSTSIATTLYYLAKEPSVQDKIFAEIGGSERKLEDLTADLINKIPYVGAVVNESLRIFPPGTQLGMRTSPGTMIDGNYVPQGTEVFSALYVAQHDPKNFHDPNSFIPERWIDPECRDEKRASQPFSLGSMNCIGKPIALMELRLLVAHVVHQFRIELPGKDFDLSQNKGYALGLWYLCPIKLRFVARKA